MAALAPAIVIVFLFANSYTAWAHVVSRSGYTYWSNDLCTWAQSETYDGSKQGGTKSIAALYSMLSTPIGDYACDDALNATPGYLQTQWNVHRFRADQTLYWCASGSPMRNPVSTHSYAVYWDFRSPPCGKGHYTNRTWSFHKNGGQWFGGDMWSGRHWWPS